jgi:hypothetical protein
MSKHTLSDSSVLRHVARLLCAFSVAMMGCVAPADPGADVCDDGEVCEDGAAAEAVGAAEQALDVCEEAREIIETQQRTIVVLEERLVDLYLFTSNPTAGCASKTGIEKHVCECIAEGNGAGGGLTACLDAKAGGAAGGL